MRLRWCNLDLSLNLIYKFFSCAYKYRSYLPLYYPDVTYNPLCSMRNNKSVTRAPPETGENQQTACNNPGIFTTPISRGYSNQNLQKPSNLNKLFPHRKIFLIENTTTIISRRIFFSVAHLPYCPMLIAQPTTFELSDSLESVVFTS